MENPIRLERLRDDAEIRNSPGVKSIIDRGRIMRRGAIVLSVLVLHFYRFRWECSAGAKQRGAESAHLSRHDDPGTIVTINYQHRSGSTTIGFQARLCCPLQRTAKVNGKVAASKSTLSSANWSRRKVRQRISDLCVVAITPEGKSNNLGEILLDGTRAKST